MALKFIPPPTVARYALYINGGDLTTYKLLGVAKRVYRSRYRPPAAKILERVGDSWFVLYDIPEGATVENGKLPWYRKEASGYSRRWGYTDDERYVRHQMTRDEYAEWRIAVQREIDGVELATVKPYSVTVR